jgi:hypothetical protein
VDSELLYFKMQMLQAEIKMNAMIAENKKSEIEGNPPVYVEKDFMGIMDEYSIYHNSFPFPRG